MAGWLLLQRDISDHWIWKIKDPFDKRSAWIDLLMLANFRDFKTTCNGKVVYRKRGDVNTSIRHLADRWQWDKRTVKRFLVLLESDGMCTVHSTTDGTTITIENYDKYQLRGTTVGTTDTTTEGTTVGTTVGTTTSPHENKDISKSKKKDKESITNKHPRNIIPPTHEMVSDYIYENGYNVDPDAFMDYYDSKGWIVGKAKMKDWQATVRNWDRKETTQQRSKNPFTEMRLKGELL